MKRNILKSKKHFLLATIATAVLMLTMGTWVKCYAQIGLTKQVVKHLINAQNEINSTHQPCAEPISDDNALAAAMAYEASNANKLLTSNFTVRIFFHIVRYNDKSHAAATESQVKNEFNTMAGDIGLGNICFINCGFDYVDNAYLDTGYTNGIDPTTMFDPYRVPNCINVFYVNQIKGNNANCPGGCGIGGLAFGSPSITCLVAHGSIGGQTTSHEVGHCLGLKHTFRHGTTANSYECINGSNSSSTGDYITDTPADPYGYANFTPPCYATSGGLYTGTCTDPCGQSNFTPPYNNIMSYWGNLGNPQLLTTGQFSRINGFLNTYTDLQNCISYPAVILNPSSISSGFLMISSIAPMTTNGSNNITGTAVVTLGGESVILSPGFHSQPSIGGLLLIRGPQCTANPPRVFSEINAQNITYENINNIKCFPNPFSNTMTIEFSLIKEDNASINLYDLMGKKIKTISQSSYTKGKHDLSLDASDIPAGIYLVVVQCSDYRKEQKVIKVN